MIVVAGALQLAAPSLAAADTAVVLDISSDSQDASATIRRVWRDLAAAGYAGVDESVVSALSSKMPARSIEARTRRFGAAKDAYSLFQLDRALELLAQVDRLLVDVDPAEIRDHLAERYVLEALIQHSRGARADAIDAFRLAHRLDPDRKTLDSGRYQPEIVELYRQAVRANARAKPVKAPWKSSPPASITRRQNEGNQRLT